MQQKGPVISGTTRFYGLFADPVAHLQAPGVFNSLLERHGVDAFFIPLHVKAEHMEAALFGMRHILNFAGYGVSIPHKVMAARLCDELLPNARACGVANVIRVDPDGRLVGETLDGVGMVRALKTKRKLNADTKVLLVGAGGVGRAIAVALALEGIRYIAISNRTRAKAEDLVHTVCRAAPGCNAEVWTHFTLDAFDIIINATSLGLHGQGPLPVDISKAPETALIAEVIMVPEVTPLLVRAQNQGLEIVPGREMLTQQVEAVAEFLGMI